MCTTERLNVSVSMLTSDAVKRAPATHAVPFKSMLSVMDCLITRTRTRCLAHLQLQPQLEAGAGGARALDTANLPSTLDTAPAAGAAEAGMAWVGDASLRDGLHAFESPMGTSAGGLDASPGVMHRVLNIELTRAQRASRRTRALGPRVSAVHAARLRQRSGLDAARRIGTG